MILKNLLVFILVFSFGVGCGPDKAVEKEKLIQTTNDTKNSKSSYWGELRASTGITKAQTNKLIKINKEYNKKQKLLKQSNKWKGQANKKERKKLVADKTKAIKKVLGPKLYSKKNAFDKNRRKINAAKKS